MYTFDFASSARLCLQTKLPLSWQRAMLYQKVLDPRQGLLSQWQCRLAARTLSWWFPGNNGRKSMFWKFIWKRVLHRFFFIRITWLRPLPRDSSQNLKITTWSYIDSHHITANETTKKNSWSPSSYKIDYA